MSIYTKPLRMNIIYWPKANNSDYGKPVFGDPVPLKGRWDACEENIITPNGRTVISKTQVMLSDIVIAGGMLQNFGLDPLPDPLPASPPTQLLGGLEILKFAVYGNIHQTKFVRLAFV